MAAGFLRHLAGDRIQVLSAGSQPADTINQVAVAAMAEERIDITSEAPKVLTTESVQESDVVITMGCGDECPTSRASATRTGSSTTRRARASSPCGPSATGSGPGSRPSSGSSSRSEPRDDGAGSRHRVSTTLAGDGRLVP
jgi:protein-tyrosine-phosphatase